MKSSVIALLIGTAVAGVCYDGDENKIDDCKCHETCGDCGRWSNPVYEDDCIDCQEGYTHTPVYSDGTGMCTKLAMDMDMDMEEMKWDEEPWEFSDDYSMDYPMEDYSYDYSWDSSNSTMNSTEWDYPEWEDDYYYTMEDYPEMYDDEWYGYDEWDYGYDDYYYMYDYGYDYYDYGYYDFDYGEYYPAYAYADSYYNGSTSWMDDVQNGAEDAMYEVENWWNDNVSQSANGMLAASATIAAVLAIQA